MSDDTITEYEASLVELGFNAAHDLTLAALLPDYDEREAIVVHVAHNLIPLDPETNLRPYCMLWISTLRAALRRRHPEAAEHTTETAAEALILLALILDPTTLPPLGQPPALLKPVDQPAEALAKLHLKFS